MTSKQDIRKMLRQRALTGSPAEASAVINQLRQHPRFAAAHTILLYKALPEEIPTQGLLDELVSEGKTVLLPRVVNDTDMEVRCYSGKQHLQKGPFGIMEPTGALFTDYPAIDLVIVPAMAFDQKGHRLGRGKGYYDRFLPLLKNAYKIGICYPERLLEHIPTDAHDITMDEVIA